ncbi:sporulation-specific protein 2 [Ancistrocladus abbreviatus]
MMPMACQNIEIGRIGVDGIACGCSSNASFDRFYMKNNAKGIERSSRRGHGARKLLRFRSRDVRDCRVYSIKTEDTLVNVLDVKREKSSPITLTNLFDVVADDLRTLNKNLQSIVGAENPVLMSAAEQIFGAGGKRMRPALVFLVSRATAELVGLKELTMKHRRLAEIIEMIHTASLIHDDVLDESDMRRGKETVHQLFGTRVAVLAGDYMFAQSSWYLANLENIEVIKLISQVIKDFASGEIKQASSLFDCDVELDEYLLKSYYKTASLIAASTKGAAIFSKSAVQLGKPVGADLAKGNLTAPVIYALERQPKLRDLIESEFSDSGSLDEAIKLVKSCGGIEQALDLAKQKANDALQNLRCLPQGVYRAALERMVLYNLERIE